MYVVCVYIVHTWRNVQYGSPAERGPRTMVVQSVRANDGCSEREGSSPSKQVAIRVPMAVTVSVIAAKKLTWFPAFLHYPFSLSLRT